METNNKPLSVEQMNKETSEELIKYFEQKNTPFTIAKRKEENDGEKYYIICHGRVMTYPYNTYKEAKDAIKYHSWDLLTAFIFLITEINSKTTSSETIGKEIQK